MSIIIHDLYCPDCSVIKTDEMYNRDSMPICSGCDKPMLVYWGGKKTIRKADNFTPLTYEDIHYNTKEEWDNKIRSIERNIGESVVVESDSKSSKTQRAEAAWQAGYDERKRLGVNSHDEAREYGRHIKDYNSTRR